MPIGRLAATGPLVRVALLLSLFLVGAPVWGFNLWPDLPGLRYPSIYKTSNQQHDAHPTHPQPADGGDEGLSIVETARRRLWRWAVWRRLYHASAVSVLKQNQPPRRPLFRFGESDRNKRPRLEFCPPSVFELSVPDMGPVPVASSGQCSSIHLVTRATSEEQKSLVYVNGTEVSGHLRSPVTLPSPTFTLSDSVDSLLPGMSPSSDDVTLCLHGEFTIHKPAYLHITPLRAGARPMLWVTQFSLTSRGSVAGIDLFSSRPQEIRLSHAFCWPNEVRHLPAGTVKGTTDEAMLVADGFLMPGRSDGGLYIVQEPGKASEKVTRITKYRTGWFYHKAVWMKDLMGEGSRACVLTARATKPFFGQSAGELVLLFQPEGPFPLAEWNTPWEEVVLVRGPDVMFDVTDLDPTDDIVEVFAAEFFTQRLTLHRIRKGDWRTRRRPRVVSSEIIDDTLGPAYSVVVADLKGQGKPSHVLVSSHECQYEGMASSSAAAGSTIATTEAILLQEEEAEEREIGAPPPLSDPASLWDGGSVDEEGEEQRVVMTGLEQEQKPPQAPTSPPPPPRSPSTTSSSPSSDGSSSGVSNLKGGSLFAYEIPVYSREGGGVRTWKRTTIATGFQVRTWGQINPGAPGFSYLFYPHSDLANVPGQRPSILLAGDCSHAAYVYRPVGSGDDEIRYELMCEINCGGTVGSLAVAYLPLFGGQQEPQQQRPPSQGGSSSSSSSEGGGGWARLFLPNFDTNKVYVFAFGPRRSVLGLSTKEESLMLSAPSEEVNHLEADRRSRRQEEEAVLHSAKSYGRARADITKLT